MSEQHRLQVIRTVKDHVTEGPANPQKVIGNSTQQIEPPANPQKTIEQSTTSLADDARLTPTQRKHFERREGEGKNVKGSFDKLKARVDEALANGGVEMTKALPVTQATEVGELDQAALIAKLKAPKAPHVDMTKALSPAFDKARALVKSLEAGYATDSDGMSGGDALRKQSLEKRIQATVVPVPLTGDQITKAASAALSAGAITGAEANHIATHVALNGGKHCDADLLKKIGCRK